MVGCDRSCTAGAHVSTEVLLYSGPCVDASATWFEAGRGLRGTADATGALHADGVPELRHQRGGAARRRVRGASLRGWNPRRAVLGNRSSHFKGATISGTSWLRGLGTDTLCPSLPRKNLATFRTWPEGSRKFRIRVTQASERPETRTRIVPHKKTFRSCGKTQKTQGRGAGPRSSSTYSEPRNLESSRVCLPTANPGNRKLG